MNTQEQARLMLADELSQYYDMPTQNLLDNWELGHPIAIGLSPNETDIIFATIEKALTLSSTPSPSADAETRAALEAAKAGIQAFLDMVNVIQRVQALPIPAILETAQHNCPIIIQQIEAVLTTPVSEES